MYLLQEGADLKLKDSENDSVLHFACMKALPQGRHDSTLEFLLTTLVSSDILNSQNTNGDTPLLVAVRCGFVKRALLLLKHKADPLIGNNKQELPLHRSCSDEANMEVDFTTSTHARTHTRTHAHFLCSVSFVCVCVFVFVYIMCCVYYCDVRMYIYIYVSTLIMLYITTTYSLSYNVHMCTDTHPYRHSTLYHQLQYTTHK